MRRILILTMIVVLLLALGSPELVGSVSVDYDELGDLATSSDLNLDGNVDLVDLFILAGGWLEEGCPSGEDCFSDIFPMCGDGSVDLGDFRLFAAQWLVCTDPAVPQCVHKPLTLKEPPIMSLGSAMPGSCGKPCSQSGVPNPSANPTHGINLFSGEFCETVTDLQIPGQGPDFTWSRTYRSRVGRTTEIGNGWDHSYNLRIEPCGAHFIVHGGNGRRDLFRRQPDGTWAREGFFQELVQNPDDTCTMTFSDTGTWRFHSVHDSEVAGKIMTIADRNNNSLTFNYDPQGRLESIDDTLGRTIGIDYNADGFIESITDFTGRRVAYAYYDGIDPNGAFGDLKSVTSPPVTGTPNGNDFPEGKTTIYTYSTGSSDERLNHNLLTITDPLGQTYLHNVYSETADPDNISFDHVMRQIRGNADEIIDLVYVSTSPDPATQYAVGKTVANDRVGNVKEYFYDNLNRLVIKREYTGRAESHTPTHLELNQNPPVNPLRPEDPYFFETTYEYNADSLLTQIGYPKGNYITNVYELELDPYAPRRSRGNLRAVHRYGGALEGSTDPNEITEWYEYDAGMGGCCGTNFVTRYVNGNGIEFLHSYDENGNRILTEYPALAIERRSEYNEYGQIIRHDILEDGLLMRRNEFRYYSSGAQEGYLKEEIVDANDLRLVTTYTYDEVGNVISQTDARGHTTLYSVNQLNQVVMETSPAPISCESKYYYDACDNLVKVEKPYNGGSAQTNYTYDILDHLISMEQEAGDGSSILTQYGYDGNRNQIYEIDPNGHVTFSVYDERDLLFQKTRGYGSLEASRQTWHYDQNRNNTELYNGLEILVHENTYDGYDRLIRSVNAMGFTDIYSYDNVGNRTSITDSHGNVTSYTHDPLNRLITITDALLQETHYSYNPVGNIISRTDANGNTTESTYDGANRLVAVTNALGYSTTLTYDAAGNNTSVTDSNGNVTTYNYDEMNRLITVTDSNGNITAYTYDCAGNMLSVTDPKGYTTYYEYDALNRLVSITNALGHTTGYSYDPAGNRIFETDAKGSSTSYSYDSLNRLIRVTDALGGRMGYSYDPVGNRISETDANGNMTVFGYDDLNRLIALTDPNGNVTLYSYDSVSNRISKTDGNANTTRYSYDELNRLRKVTDPYEEEISYSYDPVGNRISETDATGNPTNYTYDPLNRLIAVTNCMGFPFEYEYDQVGNVIRQTNEKGYSSTYTYDPLNRLVTISNALGNSVLYEYDSCGNQIRRTNEKGCITTYEYDPLNRLIQTTDSNGNAQSTVYDVVGNIMSEIEENGYTTQYEYDGLNRLIKITNPENKIWTFAYDPMGLRSKRTDANLKTTQYSYSHTNRLQRVEYANGSSVNFTYDGAGNATKVVHIGGLNDIHYFGYDKLNRLSSTTIDYGGAFSKTTSYTYDAAGNKESMTYPDGHIISYTYDGLHRMTQINEPGVGITDYQYDEVGNITQIVYPNGYYEGHVYDAVDRVINLITYNHMGDEHWNYSYAYDGVGNISSIYEAFLGTTTVYQYDVLNRLTDVQELPASTTTSYSYDGAGNRTTETVNGLITPYTYDKANRLLTQGATSYTYDDNGNRLTKSQGPVTTSYTYNFENRLKSISLPGGNTYSYQYSLGGNIYQKTVTTPAPASMGLTANGGTAVTHQTPDLTVCKWDPRSRGDKKCPRCYRCIIEDQTPVPIEESDATGTPQSTTTSGPTAEPVTMSQMGQTYVYLTNHQASVTNVVDMGGMERLAYEYDPFGATHLTWGWSPPENSINFMANQYEEDTGLYQADRGRFYEPETGRFLSPDMDAIQPGNIGGGRNAYTFEYNNPVDAPARAYNPAGRQRYPASYNQVSEPGAVFSGCSDCQQMPRSVIGMADCDYRGGGSQIYGGPGWKDLPKRCKNHFNKKGKEGKDKHKPKRWKNQSSPNKWDWTKDEMEYCGVVGVICEHERVHQKDMDKLCKAIDKCYNNLSKGDRRQTPVSSCKTPMHKQWMDACSDWTECNAYNDTVDRLGKLAGKWDCCCDENEKGNHGSPTDTEENQQCCRMICYYLRGAEAKKKDHCEKAKGADEDKCKNAKGIKGKK